MTVSSAGERYVIERTLGGGASGLVYLAYDQERRQRVALKWLRRLDAASLFRFKQEFRSLSHVVHRNLAALYELVAEEDGRWFLTMEYVEGVTLMTYLRGVDPAAANAVSDRDSPPGMPFGSSSDAATIATPIRGGRAVTREVPSPPPADDSVPRERRLPDRGKLKLERLRPAMRQLAEALVALHESGHVHRDIKPSNVLVTHDGRVVVIDFGVMAEMQAIGAHQGPVELAGTPRYMSPEQLRREEHVTPASDWYAFGMVLYESLTGVRPFRGTLAEITKAKQEGEPPPPRAFWPEVPVDLDDLCVALLQRDPALRATGEEVLRVLVPTDRAPPLQRVPSLAGQEIPLVGRKPHLAALRQAFADTRAARPVAMLVPGRSGMGKSVLLRRFLEDLCREDPSVVVLAGRCYEGETVAYKALDSLVDATCRYLLSLDRETTKRLMPDDIVALATAFPVMRRVAVVADVMREREGRAVEALELRRRAFAALRELFARIAMRAPLVLYIDDLQWGDTESAPMIASLVGPQAPPLLLVVSYRSEEVKGGTLLEMLEAMASEEHGPQGHLRRLPVEGLDTDHAATLAGALLGLRADAALITRIVEEAQGSPYFVNELVRYAVESAGVGEHATTLDSVILARVQRLSPVARRLLEVIAVAGGPVTQNIVRRTALAAQGREESADVDEQRAMRELRAGHFIAAGGSREQDHVETYHDRVREAVLGQLSEEQRRRWHQRFAETLDTTDAPQWPEQIYTLARHYYQSHPSGSAMRAFEVNYLAAQTAVASFAYQQAYRFVEQARSVATQSDIAIDAAFEQLAGEVGARTGHLDEAVSSLQRALEQSQSPLQRAKLHFEVGKVFLGRLDLEASFSEFARSLRELRLRLRRRLLPLLLVGLKDLLIGLRILRDPERFGGATGAEHDRLVLIYSIYERVTLTAYFAMDSLRFVLFSLMMLRPAARLGQSRELCSSYAGIGAVLASIGKRGLSERLQHRSVEIAEHVDDPALIGRATVYRAIADHFLGGTTTAAAIFEETLTRYGDWMENVDYFNAVAVYAWNLLLRGHAEQGWRWIQQGIRRAALVSDEAGLSHGHTYRCYAGPLLSMLGRSAEGEAHLADYRKIIEATPHDRFRWSQYLGHRAMCQVVQGRVDEQLDETFAEHRRLHIRAKGAPMQLRHYYVALCYARLWQYQRATAAGRARAGARLQRAMRFLSKTATHPTLRAHWLVIEGISSRIDGRVGVSRGLLDQAEALARQTDNRWVLHEVDRQRARIARDEGDTGRALLHARRAYAFARDASWVPRAREVAEEFGLDLPGASGAAS